MRKQIGLSRWWMRERVEKRSGGYLHDCDIIGVGELLKPWAVDEEVARGLWELSEGLVGEKFRL